MNLNSNIINSNCTSNINSFQPIRKSRIDISYQSKSINFFKEMNRINSHGLKPSRSSHSLHSIPLSSRQLKDIQLKGDHDDCDDHLSES